MATAARAPLSLIAETPEEQGYLEELKASRKALQDALLNRQQLFDPTLLAMAQGFLAPTRSGGFGESLGNVAAQLGPVLEREQKQNLQMAQIRAELAAQEAAEAQGRQELRLLREMPSVVGGAPSAGAPSGAPAAPGSPAAPGAPAAAGAAAPASREVTTSNPNQVLQYVERLSRSGSPVLRDAAKQTLELLKFQREGIEMREGILIDKNRVDASGMPVVLADLRQKQEPTEIVYQGKPRTIMMTGLEIQGFKAAKEQGPEAEKKFFDTYLAGRRSGPEAMPYGGEAAQFTIRMPDPQNPSQLLTFSGNASPRQRARLEQLEEEAFDTGNFSALRNFYTQVTGQGQYAPRTPAPSAPAATAAAPGTRVAPSEQAARDVDRRQIIGNELSAASQRMADAIRDNNPDAERQARADIASLRREVSSAQGLPAGLAVDPELASLPISEQVKITVDRIKASEKEASDQIGLIRQVGAPTQVEASDRRNEEILRLARENPKVFNLMAQQGLFTALAAAANEGFKVGQYSVSAPAKTFLEKLKLSPQEQAVARRVTMLLDEEFFNRAVYNKTVLGPQISNADATLMKSPMARPEDSAKIIAYWAQHALLTNRQARDLYNAAMKYPANRSPKYFIGEDAANIMSAYTPRYQVLQRQFSVGGQ